MSKYKCRKAGYHSQIDVNDSSVGREVWAREDISSWKNSVWKGIEIGKEQPVLELQVSVVHC